MASEAALKFLREQNRPFSATDVAQNVDKKFGKPAVQKALDKLVAEKLIFEKTYSKQKIYCIKQGEFGGPNMEEELKSMDREINQANIELSEILGTLHNKNEIKNTLLSKKPVEVLKKEKEALDAEIADLKNKLDKYKDAPEPVCLEERIKIYGNYEKYAKQYKKIKRMCMDIVNAILDGYPKTKKHLFEDVGIETDEEVGFVLKEF